MADFDTNVQSIAKETLLPRAVDIINNGNVLTSRILGNIKTWSGTKMEKTIITTQAGNGGSFTGLDRFNTNASDTKQKLSFDVRGYEQPVVIPQMEADAVASSPQRSVEYVKEAIEEAANEMADNIGTLFYADGTGNSSKDYLGLAAIADDGGEVATYGGLARSTFTGLQASETDIGGALTLAVMATSFDAVQIGSEQPTVIYTTRTIWSDYEALLQPTIQNTQVGFRKITATRTNVPAEALKGEAGFDMLHYRAVPIVGDEKGTSGVMWMLNEKHLAFYRLKTTDPSFSNIGIGGNRHIEGVYSDSNAITGFDWSGFLRPIDQHARVGHIILQGNLISFDPRKHAVLNTIS